MGLLEIFGVSESYKLPDAIMACLLSGDASEKLAEIKYMEATQGRCAGFSFWRTYG